MRIANNAFELARPVLQPMNLNDSTAAYCLDCYATTSGLDPLRALKPIAAGFANTKTLYRNGLDFVSLAGRYSIVPSPVIQDSYQRVFITDDDAGGLIQVTEDSFVTNDSGEVDGRALSGLETPVSQPSAELMQVVDDIPVAVDLTTVTPEKYTSFIVTFVTDRGEETAGSPASDPIGYVDSDNYGIRLTNLPVSAYSFVTRRRIYMAVDGDYYLLSEIGASGTTFLIDPFDDDLVSDLYSTGDFAPPLPALMGLVGLSSGSLAGFVNDGSTGTVCVSEPYQPHAWPVGYRFKTFSPVVALAVVPEGLLVLTKGKPMIVIGDSPDVMSAHVIESTESCLAASSVLVVNGVCYWASSDGIAAFGGGSVQVVSRATWSREQWQALSPASMLFAYYELHLVIYAGVDGHSNVSPVSAWLYSLSRHDVSELSESGVSAVWADIEDDRLYVVRDNVLHSFGENDHLTAVWLSKDYHLQGMNVLNSGRIDADEYPVQLVLSVGNSLTEFSQLVDKLVVDNRLFRVRAMGRKRLMRYELRTRQRVRYLQLADSAQEIA